MNELSRAFAARQARAHGEGEEDDRFWLDVDQSVAPPLRSITYRIGHDNQSDSPVTRKETWTPALSPTATSFGSIRRVPQSSSSNRTRPAANAYKDDGAGVTTSTGFIEKESRAGGMAGRGRRTGGEGGAGLGGGGFTDKLAMLKALALTSSSSSAAAQGDQLTTFPHAQSSKPAREREEREREREREREAPLSPASTQVGHVPCDPSTASTPSTSGSATAMTSRTGTLTLSESDVITQDPDSDLEDRMGFVGDRNRPESQSRRLLVRAQSLAAPVRQFDSAASVFGGEVGSNGREGKGRGEAWAGDGGEGMGGTGGDRRGSKRAAGVFGRKSNERGGAGAAGGGGGRSMARASSPVGGRGSGSVGVEESTLPSVSLSLAREGLSNFSTPSVWGAGKHAPVVTGPIRDTLAREGGREGERETRQPRTWKGRQTLAEYKASVAREEAVMTARGEGGGHGGGMKVPKSLASSSTSVVSVEMGLFPSSSKALSAYAAHAAAYAAHAAADSTCLDAYGGGGRRGGGRGERDRAKPGKQQKHGGEGRGREVQGVREDAGGVGGE